MRQEATKWKLLCILVVLYTWRMAHQIVLNYMARGAEDVADSTLKEPVATVFCLHLRRGRKSQVSISWSMMLISWNMDIGLHQKKS